MSWILKLQSRKLNLNKHPNLPILIHLCPEQKLSLRQPQIPPNRNSFPLSNRHPRRSDIIRPSKDKRVHPGFGLKHPTMSLC